MAQFLEVVEWLDETGREMVHRIPESGSAEIKFGAQLVVRESQAAVFFRDGKGYDVIGPGRHTLSTLNLPVLTKVLSLPFGFKSPFRVEVYFTNLKVFTHMRWGTTEPVAFKDQELGVVRLRGFGLYTVRIVQPLLFINTLIGTQGIFTTEEISDYLREVIVSRLNDLLGESLKGIFDLPHHYDELGVALKARVHQDFQKYGLELMDLLINNITPPDDVQRMIDERSGMGAVGDLDAFLKFKAAKALGDAAKAEGGAAGTTAAAGMGMGVGAGMGIMLPGILMNGMQEGGKVFPSRRKVQCHKCFARIPMDARFCPSCGHQILKANVCPQCGADLPPEANFCMLCGARIQKVETLCPKCQTRAMPGAVYCNQCGEKLP
ncbi:MAG: SPFH domain-containing protein [Thermodesulfobacteriota bacterium]